MLIAVADVGAGERDTSHTKLVCPANEGAHASLIHGKM